MSSPAVKQAREAFGARLREIRKDANLSARALAALCDWHYTKVSKLEHGTTSPSDDDLRQWCQHCNAGDQLPDLIATSRSIQSMYNEWHRLMRTGLKKMQESAVPLYERTKLFRGYETQVIPGLFHTADYAAALFAFWADFMSLPIDTDQAVETRMERQRVLYSGDRRFVFILEEQSLRTRVGDVAVMAGQLDRLLTVMSLPRVSLAIIPADAERYSFTQGSFWIFDESCVKVEGVSAGLEILQPREIALYVSVFGLLQRSAVVGEAARELIKKAIQDLGQGGAAVR